MDKDKIILKIENAILDGVFPGAVLLCGLDHKIVFHKSFGMADIFEKRKMKKDSIFDLASLTKPLATTLALSWLIDNNQILLDQKIGSIIEEFKSSDKADITIDMLLRHTSRLPAHREYYKKIIKTNKDPKKYLRHLLVQEPLKNQIQGNKDCEDQIYSDLGFMVLSWVIEKTSGQSLDQFVVNQIYSPLGIKDLFFRKFDPKGQKLNKDLSRFVATQDCPWRKKLLVGEVDDDNAWAAGGVDGHAGLFGDARSIYTICCEILNALADQPTKVLSSDIINTLVKKKNNYDMVAGFDTPSKMNSSCGIHFSKSSIGHLGFTGTSFWIDPETSLIVVLLTNRVHPLRSNEGIKKFRPQIHDLVFEKFIQNIAH